MTLVNNTLTTKETNVRIPQALCSGRNHHDHQRPAAQDSVVQASGLSPAICAGVLELCNGVISISTLVTCDLARIVKHDYVFLTTGVRQF